MAWARYKNVKAMLDKNTIHISNETVYNQLIQFEIQDYDWEKYQDIKKICFADCVMLKFPDVNCLLNVAPNFDRLILFRTNLTRIHAYDLVGFEKLVELDLELSEIEELPSDLFIHTRNLQHISFYSNNIKVIGKNILKPLKDLKYFDLRDNPGIDVCYDQTGKDGNLTLAQFKEAIKRCKNLKEKFEAQEKEVIDLKRLCMGQRAKIEGLEKKLEGQKKANDDVKKHCDALEKKLEEAKQDGAFYMFDFTIKINGKTFKVQKETLAANSPLLANLIRDNEDADTLELKDISEESFEEILKFMVKKTQPKPTANFIEIYAASGRLQMEELMELCARTLMEKITQENAAEILVLCKKYPNMELGKKALDEMKKIYEKH